jgi:hypothetical protein
MMLFNPTPSTLSFTLSTSSPHFTITPSPTTPPLCHGDTSLSPHTGSSVCGTMIKILVNVIHSVLFQGCTCMYIVHM